MNSLNKQPNTKYANITVQYPFPIYEPKGEIREADKKIAKTIIDATKGSFIADADYLKDLHVLGEEDILNTLPSAKKVKEIREKVGKALVKMNANSNAEEITNYVIDKTTGLEKIGPLLRDPDLEEIMINKEGQEIFVYHKNFRMCKTKIKFKEEELIKTIKKIAKTAGKEFNEQNPILNARLPDGSRVNATLNLVTPFGTTITIRKFTKKPLSITQLIENKTISSELASLLWLAVDGFDINPQNILIIGGAGTGKTTLLIALTNFIRHSERILTIEDVPEINLADRENWVALESKPKSPINPEITMEDLLINSLRMRPDRIIVGEVRGEEAQTLFTAMDTGHNGILGTLHANNPKETILRLKSHPMDVPETNLPLLNLIIEVDKHFDPKTGLNRYVNAVAELERLEDKVLLSNIFEYDLDEKQLFKTNVPSRIIEKIAEIAGKTKNDIKKELEIREEILDEMVKEKIFDYLDVNKIIKKYYEKEN
jgi:archaeal flagellar protein FlaI